MLVVDALTTDYGPVRAVDDVSLQVSEGTVTAVLGANGAGKTTLLRTISGLVRPSGGGVKLGEEELTPLPVEEIVRRGVAHVPEGGGVISELTVEENLRLAAVWQRSGSAPLEEIYELFPRLQERRTQPASRLSGGERQMLSIGRALVPRPRMLLLDEPSLGLAPILVAQIMGLVRAVSKGKASGTAVIEGSITDGYLPSSSDTSNPWIQLFMKVHAKYDASAPFDGNVEYGMANAYTLVQALQAAGKNLTRTALVDAVNKSGASWKGPGLVPFRSSQSDHGGFSGAAMAMVKGGKVVLTGTPLTTDPTAGSPITPYTTAQPAPPASGVPSQ